MIACAVILLGCKKYLDKPPDNYYAYPNSVENLQAILDNPEYMNYAKTPSFAEASADDYYILQDGFNSAFELERQAYIWGVPNFSSTNDWAVNYAPVYVANTCLDNIDNISRTTANRAGWDNVKGSAYFFRSYFFQQLVWTYAKAYDVATADTDLGIVLRKSSNTFEPSVRASVKECYKQIIEDAEQAASYLPNLPLHPLRPSKAAAYGLLARTYLTMRDYDNALKYANLCWQLKNDLIDFNGDADLLSVNINDANPPFKKYNKETIFYTETSRMVAIIHPNRVYIDSALTYDDSDLRKAAYFTFEGRNKRFKGTYSQNISYFFSGIATDEILLDRIECLARKGDIITSVDELNRLLKKRWKANAFVPVPQNIQQNDLIKMILIERRKELLMRDLRWIDIKRLNKGGDTINLKRYINDQVYRLPANDNKFALPLPKDIIELTGIPQNPR